MRTLLQYSKRSSLALLSILSGLWLSCASENPMALMILDNALVGRDQSCMIKTGQTAQAILTHGTMDVTLTNRYTMYPHFRNVMPTIQQLTGETEKSLISETNTLNIRGAYVRLDLGIMCPVYDEYYDICCEPTPDGYCDEKPYTKGNQDLAPYITEGFFSPAAATVKPNEESVIKIDVVPPELGNKIFERLLKYAQSSKTSYPALWITAYVQLEAKTQDNWTIRSNVFAYPIQVCFGCLLIQKSNDSDPNNIPCHPGQDFPISSEVCYWYGIHANDPTIKFSGKVCDVCYPTLTTCGYGCNDTPVATDPYCIRP